jgi:hypothetical protein
VPNVCSVPATCTGLCLQQQTCSNPAVTTTLSGTVFAPGHVGDPPFPKPGSADPLPNVLVYVPNAPVQPFTPGVSCDTCNSTVSGSPLVSAITDVHGNFTLPNMPVGANIPLVMQLGRWRRQITIANVPACTTTVLSAAQTRLPRNKGEGDIPLMAFSTGSVDALECVLRKIGVDDAEFTLPTYLGGTGRVQIYTGLGSGGATINGDFMPTEDQLWGNQAWIDPYDRVFFPCQGAQFDQAATDQQTVINFANAGGRIFATHYSYVCFYNDVPFSGTAHWNVNQMPFPNDQTGFVNQTFPKGLLLAQWLQYVGASTTQGQIPLQVLRDDVNGVIAPSQEWMTIQNPQVTMHYTLDTPVGAPAANQCGRVLYDDFHVEDTENANPPVDGSVKFPNECAAGPMTPQEKLLEFMIFDLSPCVTPSIPSCAPKTCVELGVNCGPAGDGCGGTLQCGSCPMGQTCGGGSTPSVCDAPSCTPKTCASSASIAARRRTGAVGCSGAAPAPPARRAAAAARRGCVGTCRARRRPARSRTSAAARRATGAATSSTAGAVLRVRLAAAAGRWASAEARRACRRPTHSSGTTAVQPRTGAGTCSSAGRAARRIPAAAAASPTCAAAVGAVDRAYGRRRRSRFRRRWGTGAERRQGRIRDGLAAWRLAGARRRGGRRLLRRLVRLRLGLEPVALGARAREVVRQLGDGRALERDLGREQPHVAASCAKTHEPRHGHRHGARAGERHRKSPGSRLVARHLGKALACRCAQSWARLTLGGQPSKHRASPAR